MSDPEFVIRLVIFEYLIPMQRKARVNALCSVIGTVNVYKENNIMGMMEQLLLLGNALLSSRGYPTSFVHPLSPMRIRHCHRYNVHALLLADIEEVYIQGRRADPRAGFCIFSRRPLESRRLHFFPAALGISMASPAT